jgi:hypothetical protein
METVIKPAVDKPAVDKPAVDKPAVDKTEQDRGPSFADARSWTSAVREMAAR